MTAARPDLRVAVAGLGAIGWPVVQKLDRGISGLRLVAVSAGDQARAEAKAWDLRHPVPALGLADLAAVADLVVECIPAALFRAVAEPAVRAGRLFMPLSVGALLEHMDLVELARASGARIIPPTGALLGLDAVRAAAQGEIREVRMVTRKPPGGLAGAPYLIEHAIDLNSIGEPTRLFVGSARAAARGFPANVNVAAALALAGIGPDRTTVEIWADPTITRNTHTITVDADAARLTMTIEGVPSPENPRTGRLTPLSVLAALQGLVEPLKVGT